MNTLQNYLKQNFLNIHSPGYVIEVFNNGKTLEFIYGNKLAYPTKEPTTKDTLYDIASLTKVFTSVLIYKAYEEKLLDLNQSIYLINSNFIYLKDVKIIDLLCHNNEIYTDGFLGDAKDTQEFYKILYSAHKTSDIPTYLDIHYIILSNLLEYIYNIPFDKLVDQKIIKPLKLKNTTFNPIKDKCASCNYEYVNGTIIKDLDTGIVHDKKARRAQSLGIYTGHAGLFSTGEDMLIFLKTFLDHSLLKEETINKMLEHHDINSYNLKLLKKYLNEDLDINVLYKTVKENHNDIYLPSTYNYMGCRYRNDIMEKNDVPNCLSTNAITFSGFTGPMFVIDFEKKIIVLVMCNVLHNTKLDRITRKKMTSNLIEYILKNSNN